MQVIRVRLPATLFSVSLYRFFFSIFNPIFPFGLFSFIDTDDPADHALGSIYVSLEFYFGKWISRALDLHTGQAYGQKKHKQTITLR